MSPASKRNNSITCEDHPARRLPVAARLSGRITHKGLQWITATCVALAACPASAAAKLNLEVGRSYMDSYGTNAAFVEAVFDQRRIGDSRFNWSPDVLIGWIEGRDIGRFRPMRYSTEDSAWLVAAGARFQYGDADNWYRSLFFSFQPALQSARTQALSSSYEFVSTLGWQGRRFNIQLRHISNGSMHEPNRGETMVLVGASFDL